MARSLKVSPENIHRVKSALKRNGYPSQTKFAEHVTPCLATVKNFLNGKPVDFENFVELCEKLGLKWQDIADLEEQETPQAQIEDSSPFITGPPITHPRDFFGRKKELKRLFNLLKRHPLQNAAIIGEKRTEITPCLEGQGVP
ncbi:MAG: hypothetical protein WA919_07625 [Coleofasciculaceae cyanobacterium]